MNLFNIREKEAGTKSAEQLHEELRERILQLPGVTERPNEGIHEDAFFVGRTMFTHIHQPCHCDIRLSKEDQARILDAGRAFPHRWAPQAGYVTFVVATEEQVDPAMELIQLSYGHFAKKQTLPETNL